MDEIRPAAAPPPKRLDEDAIYLLVCDISFAVLTGLTGILCVLGSGRPQRLLGIALLFTAIISCTVAVRVKRRVRGAWTGSWLVVCLAVMLAVLIIWDTATTTFAGDGAEVGWVGFVMLGFAARAVFLLMSRPEILSAADE